MVFSFVLAYGNIIFIINEYKTNKNTTSLPRVKLNHNKYNTYIPGFMKTRSKKSVLGLFGHVPQGPSRLKIGPRNRKKMINCVEGLISQRGREKNDISFSFYIVYYGDGKKRLRRILHKVVKMALTMFSKIQTYIFSPSVYTSVPSHQLVFTSLIENSHSFFIH